MSDVLEAVQRGRVLRLFLNRPQKRNALNAELCRALAGALEDAGRDPQIGAILLTGNGIAFCAGMDLGEIAQGSVEEINRAHERLFTIGARLATPLVAAVQGAALGGGTGLVANCHVVIAAEDASFGLTEIRLGLWPFLVFRAVAAALGERRTLEMALTGRALEAREAKEIGLAHEIAPDADARALEVAESIAAFSPTAIRQGMGFVHQVRGQDWNAAGQIARRVRNEVFRSPDFQEGIRAFREKRQPRWPSLAEPGQ
ncbi:MAG: enoyl-CoA hydratase/isomerase family protein [Acidobacteriia bacterium]|nr:enoyl-CoA hydratase/isomerase family protein [Terriglobia bacterium]